ncbi:MAG: DUF1501 domain-containing protein [Planctomycetota bacterium]
MIPTRREFLEVALGATGALSFGAAQPGWLRRLPGRAAPGAGETALVVVQLSGGNDGLNTVVPYGDDEYGRHRPTLRLAERELHKIDDHLGFHPRLGGIAALYRDGLASIVQGVGYAGSDRDHGPALRAWHTADPAPGRETGWLGRVADAAQGPEHDDTPVMFVGPIAAPFALNATRAVVPAIGSLAELAVDAAPARPAEGGAEGAERSLLAHVRRTERAAQALSEAVARARDARSRVEYPSGPFAADLFTVARLIRAGAGIRIFCTELGGEGFGGFDNHANQLGNHCALLQQLSAAVSAFLRDLEAAGLLDRVLLMTFSEFGRTLAENGRRGTGHGAAAPVLLAGGRLRGGLLGVHPSLTDLDQGAPRPHTDFRRVYATVLEGWLGLPSEPVLGGSFAPLPAFAG